MEQLPNELTYYILTFCDPVPCRFVCGLWRSLIPFDWENVRDYTQKLAKSGQLNLLKWARGNDASWNEWVCTYAARGGHLEVLKWARENGAPWNESVCTYAARGGHLETLKWARENGASQRN
jgi:hypothetical protein